MIDTHTHLYLSEYDQDRQEVIEKAQNTGVDKFFLPNIDSSSIDSLLNLANAYPERCYPMMGLHPCSVKENWQEEISTIKDYLFNRKQFHFYGIGETGLD